MLILSAKYDTVYTIYNDTDIKAFKLNCLDKLEEKKEQRHNVAL